MGSNSTSYLFFESTKDSQPDLQAAGVPQAQPPSSIGRNQTFPLATRDVSAAPELLGLLDSLRDALGGGGWCLELGGDLPDLPARCRDPPGLVGSDALREDRSERNVFPLGLQEAARAGAAAKPPPPRAQDVPLRRRRSGGVGWPCVARRHARHAPPVAPRALRCRGGLGLRCRGAEPLSEEERFRRARELGERRDGRGAMGVARRRDERGGAQLRQEKSRQQGKTSA
ncbi:hypothetical protein T484DRAFT_1969491 [Baffinella frigidus]|nr:hypothetical protein T484DRAFT_1969491 [Cryptophyta sp. CCMP2293]